MKSLKAVRVLGVDPGTRSMGYGLIDCFSYQERTPVCYGAWRPDVRLPLFRRLGIIQKSLEELIRSYSPQVLVLEKSFCGPNVKTAISIGEARGLVLSLAGRYDLDLKEYSPTSVKMAIVGTGRATKEQVQKMVSMLLGGNRSFETDDESDALALAVSYVQREGAKVFA